jgi:sulfhydrogenase subunit beta (sulfur reductase)
MSESRILQKASLDGLFAKLTSSGRRILAPVIRARTEARGEGTAQERCHADERIEFEEVTTAQQLALDYVQTTRPAKAVLFPRYELMLRFKVGGKGVQTEEIKPEARPTVLFGLHPCDAASFATLKAVFTWDSGDVYFESKLANTTVIGLSCAKGDEYCFCTSVGGGPGDKRGSDILLTPVDATKFLAEILTEKGRALLALAPELFTEADGQVAAALAEIAPRFALDKLSAKLPALFPKGEIWLEQSLRCVGCGACAFVCPTCSCFDIQDERQRYSGVRLRCWDSCGFGLFTLHASGHNPRPKQSERWRQRVMHKFSYQPERLGVLGCVGCGRCSRWCPADMNLAQHVQSLAEMPA